MIARLGMTCSYVSGERRARSTTGIANVVELFKRNAPRFGLSLVSQAGLLKVNAMNPGSMKTLTWSRRISERGAAVADIVAHRR